MYPLPLAREPKTPTIMEWEQDFILVHSVGSAKYQRYNRNIVLPNQRGYLPSVPVLEAIPPSDRKPAVYEPGRLYCGCALITLDVGFVDDVHLLCVGGRLGQG